MCRFEIAGDLADDALLRRRQAERQAGDKRLEFPAAGQQRYGVLGSSRGLEALETQVVGEQFFEGEPLPARMGTEPEFVNGRVGRRTVQITNRRGQRR